MGVWAVVLIVFLVVFILLAASVLLPVRFRFHASFRNGQARYGASLRLPLIPWYIPVPSLAGRRRAEAGGSRDAGQASAPAEVARTRIASLGEVLGALKRHYPEIADIASYAVRSVTVLELRVNSSLGTGDAAETALLAGSLRAVAGIGLATVRRKGIRFKESPRVSISPVFDRACISAEVHILASIVPLRGIIAAIRFLRYVRKAKHLARGVVSKPVGWNTRA